MKRSIKLHTQLEVGDRIGGHEQFKIGGHEQFKAKIVSIISICSVIIGIFCIVDRILLTAYGYKQLYNKFYQYPLKQQLAYANSKIAELEQQLSAKDNEQAHANSEIALIAWEKALKEYKPSRKNDSLPERMRVLLRSLKGEKFSVIEQSMPGTNLSVYLRKTREEDVPKLKQEFPDLPELNL